MIRPSLTLTSSTQIEKENRNSWWRGFLSTTQQHCVHTWWKVDFVATTPAHMPMENSVSCAGNSASTRLIAISVSDTTQSALPRTKKKWKSPFRFNVRVRKPVESALISYGKRMGANSALVSCPTATTASVSSAFERGDRRSNSTTKSFALVPSAERAQISCVPAAFGSTVQRKKKNSLQNTNQRSAKKTANTLKRWEDFFLSLWESESWKVSLILSQGSGTCPFGNKCFYRHCLPDGKTVDVGEPTRPRAGLNGFGQLERLQVSFFENFLGKLKLKGIWG